MAIERAIQVIGKVIQAGKSAVSTANPADAMRNATSSAARGAIGQVPAGANSGLLRFPKMAVRGQPPQGAQALNSADRSSGGASAGSTDIPSAPSSTPSLPPSDSSN